LPTSSNHQIIKSSNHQIIKSSNHRIIKSSNHQIIIPIMSKLIEHLIYFVNECKTDQDIDKLKQLVEEFKRMQIISNFDTCHHDLNNELTLNQSPSLVIESISSYLANIYPNHILLSSIDPVTNNELYENCLTIILIYIASIRASKSDPDTMLHYLIKYSKYCMIDYAQRLIDTGTDINAKDNHGNTILHYICRSTFKGQSKSNFTMFVRMLLANGADPNIPNANFKTPLMEACLESVGIECIKILLEKITNINARDARGFMALTYCIIDYNQNWEADARCAPMLLENGATVPEWELKIAHERCELDSTLYDILKAHVDKYGFGAGIFDSQTVDTDVNMMIHRIDNIVIDDDSMII